MVKGGDGGIGAAGDTVGGDERQERVRMGGDYKRGQVQ